LSTREQAFGERGYAKVFLRPEEIALLGSALIWMKSELASAEEEVGKLGEELSDELPDRVFSHWLPVIEHTQKNLVVQAFADCDEHEDAQRKEQLSKAFEETIDLVQATQKFRHFVNKMAHEKREAED
jgi:hypothetical protein